MAFEGLFCGAVALIQPVLVSCKGVGSNPQFFLDAYGPVFCYAPIVKDFQAACAQSTARKFPIFEIIGRKSRC